MTDNKREDDNVSMWGNMVMSFDHSARVTCCWCGVPLPFLWGPQTCGLCLDPSDLQVCNTADDVEDEQVRALDTSDMEPPRRPDSALFQRLVYVDEVEEAMIEEAWNRNRHVIDSCVDATQVE